MDKPKLCDSCEYTNNCMYKRIKPKSNDLTKECAYYSKDENLILTDSEIEVKCSNCLHEPVCSLWSTIDLDDDKCHEHCFGNFIPRNAIVLDPDILDVELQLGKDKSVPMRDLIASHVIKGRL